MTLAKSHFVEALEKVNQAAKSDDLSIQQIFNLLGEKGHLILILFFSVPFLQPIPLVVLSTPLGFLIIIVSYFYLIEKPPWLPMQFRNLKVSKAILFKTIELIQKIWFYLEKVLRPRWTVLHDAKGFRMLNFALVASSAILLALPLPIPFSNTIPALAVVLNTIGQLEEDGVIIFLSFFSYLFSLVFFVGLGTGLFIGFTQYYDKMTLYFGF